MAHQEIEFILPLNSELDYNRNSRNYSKDNFDLPSLRKNNFKIEMDVQAFQKMFDLPNSFLTKEQIESDMRVNTLLDVPKQERTQIPLTCKRISLKDM